MSTRITVKDCQAKIKRENAEDGKNLADGEKGAMIEEKESRHLSRRHPREPSSRERRRFAARSGGRKA